MPSTKQKNVLRKGQLIQDILDSISAFYTAGSGMYAKVAEGLNKLNDEELNALKWMIKTTHHGGNHG